MPSISHNLRRLHVVAVAGRGDSTPITVIAIAVMLFALILIVSLGLDQTASAVVIGLIIAGLAAMRPQTAIVVTFIYLALMGDLRRYLVTTSGIVSNDPLLLIGPVVAGLLLLMAMARHELSVRSHLSKLLLALMIIMGVEMLNPLQGGITVGVAGAIFFMVPLLWYWIGQAWGTSEFLESLLTRVVVPLAVLASVLGLMQGFWGFLHYEAQWFRMAMESSARPDIRPYSFFCSWGEYPWYVATALVAIAVPLVQGRVRISLLLVPFFLFALIIQSVRGVIYGTLLAAAVLWAVQGKSTGAIGGRLVVALLGAVVVMIGGMSQLRDVDVSEQVNRNLVHTADGFLDVQNSTAGTHFQLLGSGLTQGITHPLGYGLGFPTQAGLRVGGFSSEFDFGDIFLACGAPAGIFYLYIIFVILATAISRWRDHRDQVALYAIGILALGIGHWLSGGAYAACPVIWFAIGSLDRSANADSLRLLRARKATPAPRWRIPSRVALAPRRP